MPRYYGKKPDTDESVSVNNEKLNSTVDLDNQTVTSETVKAVSERLKAVEKPVQTVSATLEDVPKKAPVRSYGATSKITKTYGASSNKKPVKAKKQKVKRKLKLRYKIVIAVLLLAAIACGGVAFYYYKQDARIQAEWDKIKFISDGKKVEDLGDSGGELSYLNEDPMDRVIDWDALKEINEDIVAWIYIPDTNIDYPVLQEPKLVTDGNYYYLHRNIYKQYEYMGCILTPKEPDGCEDLEMHTQIFGHHMIGKQMFGNLDKYKDYDFYTSQPYIYLYYPDRTERWHVWAAVDVRADNDVYKMPYEYDTQEYKDLIDWLDSHKRYTTSSGKPKNVEKTLTCSTCSGQSGGSNRFTVNCILNKTKWIDKEQELKDLQREEFRKQESIEKKNKETEYESGDYVDYFKKEYNGDDE